MEEAGGVVGVMEETMSLTSRLQFYWIIYELDCARSFIGLLIFVCDYVTISVPKV
jgi:hypothetical protein